MPRVTWNEICEIHRVIHKKHCDCMFILNLFCMQQIATRVLIKGAVSNPIYRTCAIITWFVYFLPHFSLRFIFQTIYVLKTEILHFLSLKSAVYTQERLLIKSGLWWAHGMNTIAYGNIHYWCPTPFGLFFLHMHSGRICHVGSL